MSEPNGWREGTQTKGEIIAERDALRAEVAALKAKLACYEAAAICRKVRRERGRA